MRRPRLQRAPALGGPVELLVDRLGREGDGVAEGAEGSVYVPFALPGERVLARVAGDRGELEKVLAPSPERMAPPCPHFGACGGCALQHLDHPAYLAWKVEQLRRTLARERIETEILAPYAAPPGSRRRVALHARRRGGHVALGYKARGAWDVVEIAACPIARPELVAALPAFARLAEPLFEHPRSAPTLHATLTLAGLDVDVTGVEARGGGLSADARVRVAQAAAEAGLARVSLSDEILFQARQPFVRFGGVTVGLPRGGFLQAVEAAEAHMAALILEAFEGASRVADLYCGAGAFTFRLAERASVIALDGAPAAVAALKAATGSAPGLKAIRAEVRDLVRRPLLASEMKTLDGVVFDPPRAGAFEQVQQLAASGLARVVGVSCNPATFVRDARVLLDAGFRLSRVTPVDQFLWSPHMELVGVFER